MRGTEYFFRESGGCNATYVARGEILCNEWLQEVNWQSADASWSGSKTCLMFTPIVPLPS